MVAFWLHSLQLWFDRISKKNNPLRFHGKSFWKVRFPPFPVYCLHLNSARAFRKISNFSWQLRFDEIFQVSYSKKFKQVKHASSLRVQIEKCSEKSVFCILTRFYKWCTYFLTNSRANSNCELVKIKIRNKLEFLIRILMEVPVTFCLRQLTLTRKKYRWIELQLILKKKNHV